MATRVLKRRKRKYYPLEIKKMVACFMSQGDHDIIKNAADEYRVTITHILYQGMVKQLYWMEVEKEYLEADTILPDTEGHDPDAIMRDAFSRKRDYGFSYRPYF